MSVDAVLTEIGKRLAVPVKDLRIEDLADEELEALLAGDLTPELVAKLGRVDWTEGRVVGLSENELEAILDDGRSD